MAWTDPHAEMSETEKLEEQLKELPPRDHMIVVGVMTLCSAFKQADKIEISHFRDLAWALAKSTKHVAEMDTLNFLIKNLKDAPAETTVRDVVTLLAMMSLKAQEVADKCVRDTMRLVALLPSEMGEPDARK
jgi:hypothetical protein